jgi:prophage tail gpP-like protein
MADITTRAAKGDELTHTEVDANFTNLNNLKLETSTVGVTVQGYHANLATFAGLTGIADRLPYFNGAGTLALATFTAFARSILDDADAAAARGTLGLAVGSDVQAYNAKLAAFAGLTGAADRLAEPFGVKVTAKVDTGEPFGDPNPFKIQQGETAFDAIDRGCRLRGILPVPDGKGGLLLTRGAPEGTAEALIEGQNIEAADTSVDHSGRFSKYTIKAQSAGNDEFNGDDAAGPSAESADPGVKRYRPMLIVAEVAGADVQTRADWEANVRAARARSVTVTVSGWRQGNGEVWRINRTAPVDIPTLGLKETLLIVETKFTKDPDAGTHTHLKLMSEKAFTPEPPEPEDSE